MTNSFLFNYHKTEVYGTVVVGCHAFLTSALDKDEWLASRSSCFTLEKEPPTTYSIGDRVVLTVGLNVVMA
jgi:hypothetical protein